MKIAAIAISTKTMIRKLWSTSSWHNGNMEMIRIMIIVTKICFIRYWIFERG